MDATLVTAREFDKEGAAPTWKKGYGFHPLGAWCRNTRECLAMLLRPGNAGSNTFTDHKEVLAAALRQVPARLRRKILVRVDGAGASHDLIKHLLSLTSPRRALLFTCGWMITAADEDAIRLIPAGAWKPGTAQDGTAEQDKDVAEITHLMSRAGNWPGGLRWIVRRVKPSRRQMRNLTAYEKSEPSRSAPTGHGHTRSSPAGTGSAPCPHPPDQHQPSQRHGRRTSPARSEPVRTRAPREPRAPPDPRTNGHEAKKRIPTQSVTRLQTA
jgi:DDE family transposase